MRNIIVAPCKHYNKHYKLSALFISQKALVKLIAHVIGDYEARLILELACSHKKRYGRHISVRVGEIHYFSVSSLCG